MNTKRRIFVTLAVLAAGAGHVIYQYGPRARPASPSADSPVAALLRDQSFPAAVWVPYPHQNLIYLRRVGGAEPESLRAVARLAGLPAPALPSFGPLELPPSSEIAVAADELGERFVVRAQVYPVFAVFARLAGRLAGNPWLQGGEIVVEGRPADVAWSGNLWTVTSSGLTVEAPPPAAAETAAGLAWIRIRQAVEPLPAGLYRLFEDPSGLTITSHDSPAAVPSTAVRPDGAEARALAGRLDPLGLFLLVYSGRHEALAEPAQALAFFGREGKEAKVMELPRIAALHEPGAERWSLPGESLLEIAGSEPRTALAGAWSIAALDSTSLEQARAVAPELDRLSGGNLAWGLWLDLRGGLAEVDRIAKLLAGIPIAPRRQVERWKDARLVFAPLVERYSHLTATVTDEPRVFELRLMAGSRDRAK